MPAIRQRLSIASGLIRSSLHALSCHVRTAITAPSLRFAAHALIASTAATRSAASVML